MPAFFQNLNVRFATRPSFPISEIQANIRFAPRALLSTKLRPVANYRGGFQFQPSRNGDCRGDWMCNAIRSAD